MIPNRDELEAIVHPMTFSKRRPVASPAVLSLMVLMLIPGCRDAAVTTEPPLPTESSHVTISGMMTPQSQSLQLLRNGAPLVNARVEVNGSAIPPVRDQLHPGWYVGDLGAAVAAGAMVNLKVTGEGVNFEASGEAIGAPVINAPAGGYSVASTDTVTLSWSSPAGADYFDVCLNCPAEAFDLDFHRVSGMERQFKFIPRELGLVSSGTGVIVAVYAYKDHFLNLEGSPGVTADVVFAARSAESVIQIH